MSVSGQKNAGAPDREPPIRRVVVVGGGTAGWLAACLIASRVDAACNDPVSVTLIESPDIPTIGVGEGTWPTMRGTLEKIGFAEADFLAACSASFKQGTRFDGWATGGANDRYYHPFTAPYGADRDAVMRWASAPGTAGFAASASAQPAICERNLAPRQRQMPDYAGALNYAYHLDAGKFAHLLARHGVERLGITHVSDHVTTVERGGSGMIDAVVTRDTGRIEGDLFLDCTGAAALLISGEYEVPFEDVGGILFNDRALAIQVPQLEDAPLASQTNATAHQAGWIWDIGLPERRGVGCVYSSRHVEEGQAREILDAYLAATGGTGSASAQEARLLSFRSGYRERFWEGNCLAIGQSAGFLEPLEASAIVMVELGVEALLEDFPRDRAALVPRARRFNALMRYRWARIVEFLKLHYILSRRIDPYWCDHRDPDTIPARLAELLDLWHDRPPLAADFSAIDEVFPSASWQYVLYGMGFVPPLASPMRHSSPGAVRALAAQRDQRERSLLASLPSNRAYFDALGTPPERQKVTTH
ncbi:tryptophan halogenase family protein [Qipengyuania algicida]|uniref:tryptophan halogenase family protein n=1 Tax=Qipengyuania algicida TaxID=1836209 RepID=UPI00301E347F